MTFQPYNIILLPPEHIAKEARSISHSLAKHGGLFSLQKKSFVPHISLYAVEFPTTHLKTIQKEIQTIAKNTNAFFLHSKKFRHVYDGYIDIAYSRNRAIATLQKHLIASLNPLRKNQRHKIKQAKPATQPQWEQKNIEKYGYYAVGRYFIPHLTLTKLPEKNPRILKDLKSTNLSFDVRRIALCRVGQYGTCKKILKVFSLQ